MSDWPSRAFCARSASEVPSRMRRWAVWISFHTPRRMSDIGLGGERESSHSSDPERFVEASLDRPSNSAALLLVRQDVQAALVFFRPRPPAGPLVLAGQNRPRAWPAADARIVAVVQRVVRHV